MTSLSARLSEYLDHRRRFGADMTSVGLVLKPFVNFADAEGAEWITTELFLRWKAAFGSAGPSTWSTRLPVMRGFAGWLHGIDERHDVLPKGLTPGSVIRPRPYIYSEEQIERIVAAAAALPSRSGLRGATCSTLFGLIATTGLRIGEALGLDDRDVGATCGLPPVVLVTSSRFSLTTTVRASPSPRVRSNPSTPPRRLVRVPGSASRWCTDSCTSLEAPPPRRICPPAGRACH